MKKNTLLLLLIFLCSCSTATLTPSAKKLIILKDRKHVKECRVVGIVNAESGMSDNPISTSIGNNQSMIKLKNMAAKYGNVLVLTKNKTSTITGSEREGEVYRCPDHIVFVSVPSK